MVAAAAAAAAAAAVGVFLAERAMVMVRKVGAAVLLSVGDDLWDWLFLWRLLWILWPVVGCVGSTRQCTRSKILIDGGTWSCHLWFRCEVSHGCCACA